MSRQNSNKPNIPVFDYRDIAARPNDQLAQTIEEFISRFPANNRMFSTLSVNPPAGVANSAAHQAFHRRMQQATRDFEFVFIMEGDVLIATNSFDGHLDQLDRVLARFTDNELTCSIEKCVFASHTVRFHGYRISETGVERIQ